MVILILICDLGKLMSRKLRLLARFTGLAIRVYIMLYLINLASKLISKLESYVRKHSLRLKGFKTELQSLAEAAQKLKR